MSVCVRVRRAATPCGSTCRCAQDLFHPVCGSDGVEFTSPCRAGCVAMETDSANKVAVRTDALVVPDAVSPKKNLCACFRAELHRVRLRGRGRGRGRRLGCARNLRQPLRLPPLAVCGPDGRHLSHGVPVPDAVLCHHPQARRFHNGAAKSSVDAAAYPALCLWGAFCVCVSVRTGRSRRGTSLWRWASSTCSSGSWVS